MRYPVLTRSKCHTLAAQMAQGHRPAVAPFIDWLGTGDDIDQRPIEQAAKAIEGEMATWTDKDRDRLEGVAAILIHSALSSVPIEILDDRGFWRYLALRYFWDFIAWREAGPFERGHHDKYVDARSNTESVLTRMFLRAQAVGGPDHAELAFAVRMGTDFWRSHVIRVRTGSAPAVTRALARRQVEDRLKTDALRAAARRLNRTWTNIVLHTYDDLEAVQIVDSIWDDGTDA